MNKLGKRGASAIGDLPGFFRIMMLVVIMAGLVFVVADKFLATTVNDSLVTGTANLEAGYLNSTGYTLANSLTKSNFQNPSIVAVYNGTTLLGAGNYSLSGNKIYNATASAASYNTIKINYTYEYIGSGLSPYKVINESTYSVYDYGVGFLGLIILVTMVWLIIRIVSGTSRRR